MENEIKTPKKSIWKKWWFWVIAVFVMIIITSPGGGEPTTIPKEGEKTTPASQTIGERELSIGDEGIINFREDKNDCSGEDIVPLGTSKEDIDKIGKALLAKDEIGIANLLLTREAFTVDICTKAKVIDRAFGIRQVRILEGENFGKDGWLPYEWIK